jgi:hypothetical protein
MKFRIALIVVVAVSVVVCPLSFGGWGVGVTEAQVSFVPSIEPLEITRTVEGPRLGAVTPVPTLGPGQHYEEGEEDLLPEVTRPDLLDDPFGYSEISGHPGLFLVWSTDDAGNKRYYVISVDNPYFDDIQAVTNAIHTAWADLGGEGVSGDVLRSRRELGALGTVAFGASTIYCSLAALVSAAGTVVTAPLTVVFTGCAGVSFTAAGASFMFAYYAWEKLESFNGRMERDRMAVEGFFQQLPYVIDQ